LGREERINIMQLATSLESAATGSKSSAETRAAVAALAQRLRS
jgi:hypothetical protein